ncbi:sigma-70 family RNA polymerase sigma factor [Lysinibacillus sp. UGB7]|uniref:sigma-70 family RNA polymerase sigma factor n=1 Tax=Lysinibacillus sp. UGB7 TaxID=3411039 RepID=UPI003B7A0513
MSSNTLLNSEEIIEGEDMSMVVLATAEDEELADGKVFLTEEEKEVYASENMSLIYFMVNKFRNTQVDPDELASVGTIGFTKALNNFDTSQQVKFSTYAIRCIKNEILHFLRKERNIMRRNLSMDTVLSTDKNGNELNIGELLCLEDNESDKVDSKIELGLDIEKLALVLQDLNENERFIVENRFGLGGQSVKTQREIAEEIGMSQANVSKIEKNVLGKVEKELIRRFGMTGESYK